MHDQSAKKITSANGRMRDVQFGFGSCSIRCQNIFFIVWNVIFRRRCNMQHIASVAATKKLSWLILVKHNMRRRHLHCAEQQASPSNVTKYCAWIPKWRNVKCAENGWSVIFTNGGRFGNDPSMIRTRTGHVAPARSPRILFAFWRRILYGKLSNFALRLSTQISPNTAPPVFVVAQHLVMLECMLFMMIFW